MDGLGPDVRSRRRHLASEQSLGAMLDSQMAAFGAVSNALPALAGDGNGVGSELGGARYGRLCPVAWRPPSRT
jgi:hypothetical protein